VAQDIIDDRLIGALHLLVLDRHGFRGDPAAAHVAFQAGTLNALLEGHFDGDATLRELLRHGDHGIGTIQHLAGEMVIVDGEASVVDADGVVTAVPPNMQIPFAVVCAFSPLARTEIEQPLPLSSLLEVADSLLDGSASILAIRVDGDFTDLHLRSVHAQTPPYPPLTEVTKHQTEWHLPSARGTVVGFRFPDRVAGVEVPGHHLHFLSDTRTHGGHVLDLTLLTGRVAVDGGEELHVELPKDVRLDVPGVADRGAIRAVEGGSR
jgi:acetolactate decarboxylase